MAEILLIDDEYEIRSTLSAALGRSVSFRVAALDYLSLPMILNSDMRTRVLNGKITSDLKNYGIAFPSATEGIRFGVGGGLTLPMGNYADIDKAGWHVLGLIQLPISQSPIHLRFDAMYGQTSHKSVFGSGSTTLTGATGDLLWQYQRKVTPAQSAAARLLSSV